MCKHRSIKKAEIDYSSRVWLLGTVPVAPLLRFESFDAVHTSSRRLWFESPKGPVFISRGHSTQHNLVFTTMIAHEEPPNHLHESRLHVPEPQVKRAS
jgi:hypothetical protein